MGGGIHHRKPQCTNGSKGLNKNNYSPIWNSRKDLVFRSIIKRHCWYHPHSAGLIKTKLRKVMAETGRNWVQCLSLITLNTHTLPNSGIPMETEQQPAVRAGDWVFIKVIKGKTWNSPKWEWPYQVVLTTLTAVRISERPRWTHLSNCKKVNLSTCEKVTIP